jgi:hypothetical protein
MKDLHALNNEAYKFVPMLHKKQREKPNSAPQRQFQGFGEVLDLGQVDITQEETRAPLTDEITSKYVKTNGEMIGFGEAEFRKFNAFLEDLYDTNEISGICSFDTLSKHAFKWITTVYSENKAKESISDYILNQIQANTNFYQFHFRLQGLEIEVPFQIGNTIFKYFSETEVSALYEQFLDAKPGISLEEFKNLNRDQFKFINAITNVKAEKDLAAEMAINQASLAVDVLKCFCYVYAARKDTLMFDIDFRYQPNSLASFLQLKNGDIRDGKMILQNRRGVMPIQLTTEFLEYSTRYGLLEFSDYIIQEKDNELYYKTIDLIRQFSAALSLNDHYEKVAKCISLFESLCIPENSSKARGYTYYKKVISKIYSNPKKQQSYFDVGLNHYKIRDKFMHNNIRWPMDNEEFMKFLDFTRMFIHSAIQLNRKFTSAAEFQEYFGIK